METKTLSYQASDVAAQGFIAGADQKTVSKRPVVLVVHDWSGCNDFAREKAKKIAALGYIGFAVDMYGEGRVGQTNDEKVQLMQPLIQDRARLRDRLLAALSAIREQAEVDTQKVAVIGFCFGGLCALDLARSGADILGAVAFHGLLIPPNLPRQDIKAKILALHGHDDPMVPPEQVHQFQREMIVAEVDWQMHIYGGVQHAFMNPQANDVQLGTVYNAVAERRAWSSMVNFLQEIF